MSYAMYSCTPHSNWPLCGQNTFCALICVAWFARYTVYSVQCTVCSMNCSVFRAVIRPWLRQTSEHFSSPLAPSRSSWRGWRRGPGPPNFSGIIPVWAPLGPWRSLPAPSLRPCRPPPRAHRLRARSSGSRPRPRFGQLSVVQTEGEAGQQTTAGHAHAPAWFIGEFSETMRKRTIENCHRLTTAALSMAQMCPRWN